MRDELTTGRESRTETTTAIPKVPAVPSEHFMQRVSVAERVLRDTDRAVSDIADSLGFSSESSFSHACKRSSEMGQKAYRQRSRLAQADT